MMREGDEGWVGRKLIGEGYSSGLRLLWAEDESTSSRLQVVEEGMMGLRVGEIPFETLTVRACLLSH